jgi:hypothetical protein
MMRKGSATTLPAQRYGRVRESEGIMRKTLILLSLVGLAACSNPYDPGQRALGGGLLGGAGGAAIGGLAGGGKGALIGGGVGAAGGALAGATTTPEPPPPSYYRY